MLARALLLFPLLFIACAGGTDTRDDADAADQILADVTDDIPEPADVVAPEDLLLDFHGDAETGVEVFDLLDAEDLSADLPEDTIPDVPPEDVPPEDVVEEIFEYVWQPDGPCGTTVYEWLPPDAVGGIVSWEPEPLGTMPPTLIQQLLQEFGYPALIPVNYGTRVFKMRYLTQDHGVLTEATAMVGIPDFDPGDGPSLAATTVLYLHPTLGFANKCALSGTLEGAAAAALPATMGFIAVAPDYLGMCGTEEPCEDIPHPYLIGEPTAIASWDAARAAHALLELIDASPTVVPDGKVVPWGHSQGGHAALFTDRYGPVYAPEFEIPCTIAVVPPGDLAGQALLALDALDGAARLGTGFMIAAALWYDPPAGAASLFNANGPKDYASWLLEVFPTTCNDGKFVEGAQTIDDIYNPDFILQVLGSGLESVDPWGCISLENSIPHASPPFLSTSRLLYLIAENDSLVDQGVERAAVQELCDAGYAIDFLECTGGSHTGTAIDTIGYQVTWLLECLAGEGPAPEELCILSDSVDCGAL
ncbi:MAG: lipase family protein [Pseudomonadota bacterium]